jgi:hypothetical protein
MNDVYSSNDEFQDKTYSYFLQSLVENSEDNIILIDPLKSKSE